MSQKISQELESDEFDVDSQLSTSSQGNILDKVQYEVLTANEVVKLMSKELQKVKEIVDMSPASLRPLLTKHKWRTDVFLEKFYDGSIKTTEDQQSADKENKGDNKPKKATKRKIKEPGQGAPKRKTSKNNQEKVQKMCEICLECFDPEDIAELECNHSFCQICFKKYIKNTVDSNSSIDSIKCPGYLCVTILSDEFAEDRMSVDTKTKYKQLITKGFVNSNRLIKWCVNEKCNRAIKVELSKNDQPAVKCKCGFRFCFGCDEEIHDLIPCKLLKDFNVIRAQNLDSAEWVVQNSKPCPRCKSDIEKNGGCNHISCSQCRHDFCWICLSSWTDHRACIVPDLHSFHTTDLRRLAAAVTKRKNMVESIKLDEKLYRSKVKKQKQEAQKCAWYKVDFIEDAVKVLLKCRRTIADSFIFDFYYENEGDNEWLRFHMNHYDLIAATDGLSFMLENQIDGGNFHELKQDIVNKTKHCKGLHTAVFEHAKDGFKKDTWKMRA